jgi:hypothetical protein
MGCPRPQQYCGNLSSPPVDGASCTLSVRTRSSNVSTDHIQDVVHEAVASLPRHFRLGLSLDPPMKLVGGACRSDEVPCRAGRLGLATVP